MAAEAQALRAQLERLRDQGQATADGWRLDLAQALLARLEAHAGLSRLATAGVTLAAMQPAACPGSLPVRSSAATPGALPGRPGACGFWIPAADRTNAR